MFIAERQAKIIDMIQQNGSVQVEHLAKELDVSPMTIRRDLKRLKEEGIIERCHGGAVVKQEVTYAEKQICNQDIKKLIASKCVELVKENAVVFLDAGTTTYEAAKLICNIPGVLIATNDLEIAQLVKNSEAELIVCGGTVQKSTGSMYGYYATQMMESLKFDVGFFGTASIDENFRVLTPTIEKAFLKKLLLKNCNQSFLVADNSKFNRIAMYKVADLMDYVGVITDHQFNENEVMKLTKSGIKIIPV